MFRSGIIAYQPIFDKLKSFVAIFDQTRNFGQANEWYNQKFEINMTKFRDARRMHSLVGFVNRNSAIAEFRVPSFFYPCHLLIFNAKLFWYFSPTFYHLNVFELTIGMRKKP